MPDTPVTVDGQREKFTIILPAGSTARRFGSGAGGQETLELVPERDLKIVVKNSKGLLLDAPLGTKWTVEIREL